MTATLGTTRRCATCGAEYPWDFLVCPKDKSPLAKREGDDDPLIGEVLAGSFMITSVIGEGGMGRVYEAEHVRLPKRYAVKVMHEQIASRSGAAARFEREAQAAAMINSDHVVSVIDVVRALGRTCIVTERLEGEELGELLERTAKLPLGTAITICRQVCRGLAAAHAASVIHRDLKPANIFLVTREDGPLHVKILDFGIAKIDDGAKLTQTGAVLGTPAYMAPEQAQGSAVDARTDVYAVGALLYRMLTGSAPFPDGEDPAIVLTRVLTEDPRRPRDIEKSIPPGIEALIQRAMARNPEGRPASIRDFDRHLAAFDTSGQTENTIRIMSGNKSPRADLATSDTIVALPPPGSASEADDVTLRARRARPAAMALTLAVSVTSGAAVFLGAVLLLRAATLRATPNEMETILLGVLTLLGTLFVLLSAMRVLISRWRSTPAIERLGDGLSGAMRWFFSAVGLLTLCRLTAGLVGVTLPREMLGWIDAGVVLVPAVVAGARFAVSLWHAGRA